METFFYNLGNKVVKKITDIRESLFFTVMMLKKILNPRTYTIAMVQVLVKQIYFTAVQILPFYLTIAVIIGSAIVGLIVSMAISFGLNAQIGSLIVSLVIDELAPFMTVLLLALRSGAAINTEMAVMKVSGELKSLKYFNIDPFSYLYIPRVLNGMISMLLLASLFSMVALVSGYLFLALFLHMGISLYISTIVDAVGLADILTLLFKSLLFGYAVTAIPVYRGNKSMMTYNAIPIAVLQGMVKLFIAIILIEVLSFIRLM